MKYFLLLFLFLPAAAASEPLKGRADVLRAVEQMRRFTFAEDSDRDRFPDEWFVEKGEGFQSYHSLLIDTTQGSDGSTSLRFGFSGGKAGVRSAALRLDPRFAYNITLHYKGENLGPQTRSEMTLGLKAYSENERLLQDESVRETTFPVAWTQSRTLRVERIDARARSAVLYVHLAGRPGGRGVLWVDEVAIEASPRLHIETSRPLNIFAPGEDMVFKQLIEGTQPGEEYVFKTVVRDFLDEVIDSSSRAIRGSETTLSLPASVPLADRSLSGAYYLNSSLEKGGQLIVENREILARDVAPQRGSLDPGFGVILGRPRPPYGELMTSLTRLGISLSKLDLLPRPFALAAVNGPAMKDLDELLLTLAPDAGYHFIAVVNRIPDEAYGHSKFAINPPRHVIETFPTHAEAGTYAGQHVPGWKELFEQLLLAYGSTISDWQIGDDADAVPPGSLQAAGNVMDHLRARASWSQVLVPTAWSGNAARGTLVYVPATMGYDELEARLAGTRGEGLHVTVQLDSLEEAGAVKVLENLVKKVTLLKAARGDSGQPLVQKIFVDRLTDADRGLMRPDYKPFSAYFAYKTLVSWFQDAEILGQLTLDDKDIVSYAFQKKDSGLVLLWRRAGAGPARLWLGEGVRRMDLMGNQSPLKVEDDSSFTTKLTSTPIFILSPHPELLRTLLSFRLERGDLEAAVKLQDQRAAITNHFAERAKFDIDLHYPSEWLAQNNVFALELEPGAGGASAIKLAPSPLSPLGPVPVYTDLNISLAESQKRHFVKLYREDALNSDVDVAVTFFRAVGGLNMDIHLELGKKNLRPSTFVVAALFPNGTNLEAFFRDLKPGERGTRSLFVRGSESDLGPNMSVEVKETLGRRHINRSFPVALKY